MRQRLPEATADAIVGFLAVVMGWITTEVGRQPWVVYGLLRTSDGLSVGVSASAKRQARASIAGLGDGPAWQQPVQAQTFSEEMLKDSQVTRLADLTKLDAAFHGIRDMDMPATPEAVWKAIAAAKAA